MNADKLYISAIEIENLFNELKKMQNSRATLKDKEKKFNIISSSYGRVLQLYQVNHELIDYYLMITGKKDPSRGNYFTNLVYVKAFVLPFILYNMIIIATPVLFLVFLFTV